VVTVIPNATISLSSVPGTKTQIVCINSPITNISYAIGGSGTGAIISSGAFPPGVTGNYSDGVYTISGTPTAAGTFLYTITTTGPCGQVAASGTITSYPIPSVTVISDRHYCNGGSSPSITISGPVPGTSFNWTNNNPSIGLGLSGSGNIPVFTAINNTTEPASAIITITPEANGCLGVPFNFNIIVNPTPKLNIQISPNLCSGTQFIYSPASLTAGTAFEWSRAAVAGINSAATSGTGGINEILVNVTTSPVNVNYLYTLTANGCSNEQNLVVAVSPVPIITSTLSPNDICNNTPFNYSPNFSIPGTTATWSREEVPGISNGAGAGNGSVNETLINATPNSVAAVYVYNLNSDGCTNNQHITVRIKPTPVLSGASIIPIPLSVIQQE